MPTSVSKFLGHGDLSTTTRYLNARIRGLRLALQRLEKTQKRALPKARKARSSTRNSENLASDRPHVRPDLVPVPDDPDASPSGRVVLAELFTGAGCAPCAGADLAADGLLARYPRSRVVVLMYHAHIPRPDPMANPATEERAGFYEVNGVPSLRVDGAPGPVGGGSRREARSLFDRNIAAIDAAGRAAPEARLTPKTRRTRMPQERRSSPRSTYNTPRFPVPATHRPPR